MRYLQWTQAGLVRRSIALTAYSPRGSRAGLYLPGLSSRAGPGDAERLLAGLIRPQPGRQGAWPPSQWRGMSPGFLVSADRLEEACDLEQVAVTDVVFPDMLPGCLAHALGDVRVVEQAPYL
jgi:hypothetical protein